MCLTSPLRSDPRSVEHMCVESLTGMALLGKENALVQQELVQTQKQLLRSQKLQTIGGLTTGIAHECNNMLAGLTFLTADL